MLPGGVQTLTRNTSLFAKPISDPADEAAAAIPGAPRPLHSTIALAEVSLADGCLSAHHAAHPAFHAPTQAESAAAAEVAAETKKPGLGD